MAVLSQQLLKFQLTAHTKQEDNWHATIKSIATGACNATTKPHCQLISSARSIETEQTTDKKKTTALLLKNEFS